MNRLFIFCLCLSLSNCATIKNWLGYGEQPRAYEEHESIATETGDAESCAGLRGGKLNECIDRQLQKRAQIKDSKVLPVGALKTDRVGLTDLVITTKKSCRMYGCIKNGKKDWCHTDPKMCHVDKHGCEQEPWLVKKYKQFAAWLTAAEIFAGIVYLISL